MVEFEPILVHRSFGKISRLFRDGVYTEKIDGTQLGVGVMLVKDGMRGHPDLDSPAVKLGKYSDGTEYAIYAQSRNRLISPFDDNYSSAAWVHDNAETLAADLGPGLHFGEWWGHGIQRNYGQRQKFFSLFNVQKWEPVAESFKTPNLRTVPVLSRFTFSTAEASRVLTDLAMNGSHAAPGYMNPEGIVVFHPASQSLFKATIDNDSRPKSLSQRRRLAVVDGEDLAA
jgi:hypothetical protein